MVGVVLRFDFLLKDVYTIEHGQELLRLLWDEERHLTIITRWLRNEAFIGWGLRFPPPLPRPDGNVNKATNGRPDIALFSKEVVVRSALGERQRHPLITTHWL